MFFLFALLTFVIFRYNRAKHSFFQPCIVALNLKFFLCVCCIHLDLHLFHFYKLRLTLASLTRDTAGRTNPIKDEQKRHFATLIFGVNHSGDISPNPLRHCSLQNHQSNATPSTIALNAAHMS